MVQLTGLDSTMESASSSYRRGTVIRTSHLMGSSPFPFTNENKHPTWGAFFIGAGNRTRLHYGVIVVEPPLRDSPPDCPI